MVDEVVVTKVKKGDKLSFLGRFHFLEMPTDKEAKVVFDHCCCDCGLKHETIIQKVKGAIRICMIREGT